MRAFSAVPACLAASVALPAAALATCPGPEHLETGIVVSDTDAGDSLYQEVFRASDPEIVSVEGYDAGALIYSGLLAKGFYDLTSVDFEDGRLAFSTTWLYDIPVGQFTRPGPEISEMLPVREIREDATEHASTFMFEAGSMTELVIGDCRYPAVMIRATNMAADGQVDEIDNYVYLTTLGISLFTGWTDSDNNSEKYDYEAIQPLADVLPLGN